MSELSNEVRSVYQKLVEYVRQMHPPEDSDPPSKKELTTTAMLFPAVAKSNLT